ncbi:unnamed protein product [Ectocarpus sp. 12 AP-2014]
MFVVACNSFAASYSDLNLYFIPGFFEVALSTLRRTGTITPLDTRHPIAYCYSRNPCYVLFIAVLHLLSSNRLHNHGMGGKLRPIDARAKGARNGWRGRTALSALRQRRGSPLHT